MANAKLTIVYHLHNFHANIAHSVKSLISQTSKDFNIIIVNDNVDKKVRTILAEFYDELNHVNNCKLLIFSRHLGHSYAFNFAMKYVQTPYVVFAGGESVFDKDFVKIISDNLEKFNPEILVYGFDAPCGIVCNQDLDLKNKHFYSFLIANTMNKIFSTKFLIANNLQYRNFKHYSLLFNVQCYVKANIICYLPNNLLTIYTKITRSYDLHDLVDQIEILLKDPNYMKFDQSIKQQLEYVFIRLILLNFLYESNKKFYSKDKSTFKTALVYAENFINKNFPNWENNPILCSKNNVDNPKVIKYLKEFNFSSRKVHTALQKVFENGRKQN